MYFMAKKPAYILGMLEAFSAIMLTPEILSYGAVALVFFGLGRISGRQKPRAVLYGITADVPVEQAGPNKRAWTIERALGLVFTLGWITGWTIAIASVFQAFATNPNLFVGGWLLAAVAGWVYAAYSIWRLATGQSVRMRGGREI